MSGWGCAAGKWRDEWAVLEEAGGSGDCRGLFADAETRVGRACYGVLAWVDDLG